jgi:hypothetical protein
MKKYIYRSEDEGRYVFEVASLEKIGDFYSYIGMLHISKLIKKNDKKMDFMDFLWKEINEANEEDLVVLLLANLALSKGKILVIIKYYFRFNKFKSIKKK